jgi:AmpD protein
VKIDRLTQLIEKVTYLPSPHCNERPPSELIDLVIIHGISLPPGEFGTAAIQDFFCGKLNTDLHPYYLTIDKLKVSAHLLIGREGDVTQFVPFNKRAWHAGESQFAGKSNCNDFSIGIELEGTDTIDYTSAQYQALADCIAAIRHAYPQITPQQIVGHSDVAPGRKTDPGPSFDWAYLRDLLSKHD